MLVWCYDHGDYLCISRCLISDMWHIAWLKSCAFKDSHYIKQDDRRSSDMRCTKQIYQVVLFWMWTVCAFSGGFFEFLPTFSRKRDLRTENIMLYIYKWKDYSHICVFLLLSWHWKYSWICSTSFLPSTCWYTSLPFWWTRQIWNKCSIHLSIHISVILMD